MITQGTLNPQYCCEYPKVLISNNLYLMKKLRMKCNLSQSNNISFGLKEQLMIKLQNATEVNRERSCLTASSRVYDSTKYNGLVTVFKGL